METDFNYFLVPFIILVNNYFVSIYTFQLSQQTGKIGMDLVADMWKIMTSIK